MYYKQLPCIYHPQLNITNFCQDQQCLMPLCPSCIRQHTQYHEELKTKPSYFNIYEALAETDTLITNSICNLQKDKKRNKELAYLQDKQVAWDRPLENTAGKNYGLQDHRAKLFIALEEYNGVNQQDKLGAEHAYEQSVVTNLQDVYDLAQGLKTQSCLSDMIFFLKEKRFEVEELHGQMSHYLYTNENYEPYIQISKQAQQSLSVIIHRMFKLDLKQKGTVGLSRGIVPKGQTKSFYQNSYHISLTPSKVKKPIYSLEKGASVIPAIKFNHNNSISGNSRPKNSSYQNYNQYQEHVQKSRQTSREKGMGTRGTEDNSFRQIDIKDKQRKIYYQQYEHQRNKPNQPTRRVPTSKYPNPNKF